MALLTKSKYIYGLQCEKYLWYAVNEKESIPAFDESTQARFDVGKMIGELAKKLFPNGLDIPDENFMDNINKTKRALQLNRPLFEAGFKEGNLYSRADIIRPKNDAWDIYEVKSSTSVKEVYLHDLSFQRFCYQKAGLKIGNCFVIYINNEYVRNGELDLLQLFKVEDVTKEVEKLMQGIAEKIAGMLDMLSKKIPPDKDIHKNCQSPYDCPLMEKCWAKVPKGSVFELYRAGEKAFELYENGIIEISKIPDDMKISEKQNIQKIAKKTDQPYVDKIKIKEFLDKIIYPIHYLDFETFGAAIPPYDNTRPFQQIPFQFSLHIKETENSNVEHISFLADGRSDPRKEFIEKLRNSIRSQGSILVYNADFEKRIIGELVYQFKEHNEWMIDLMPRFVDLLMPFKNFHYYDSRQEGSSSIKKVLPALTGRDYANMDIAEGEKASRMFADIASGRLQTEEELKIRSALQKYCSLDTEGMILILEKLVEIISIKTT